MKLFKFLGWRHSHCEAIETNPWTEDCYSFWFGFYLVHVQRCRTHPYLSFQEPKHLWRLARSGSDWELSFKYGLAPF